MSEITIKNIQDILMPEFIETLEHYYDELIEYAKEIQTPITLKKAYETLNDKIDEMNLTPDVADMLDNMVFNMLNHNAVSCNGLRGLIITHDIIFDVFNELFIYTLTKMFNQRVKTCFEIIDIEEDLEGLRMNYILHMKATNIILTVNKKEKIYKLVMPLYISYRTPFEYSDKNKLIGIMFYCNRDKDYSIVFDEDVD